MEVIFLENCVKAILYCYPRLGGIEEGYLEHIRNKAVLSSDGREPAQKVSEYLAMEVLQKAKVRELRETVDRALSNLSMEEKLLLSVRYFGKLDRVKRAFAAKYAGIADDNMRAVKYRIPQEQLWPRRHDRCSCTSRAGSTRRAQHPR